MLNFTRMTVSQGKFSTEITQERGAMEFTLLTHNGPVSWEPLFRRDASFIPVNQDTLLPRPTVWHATRRLWAPDQRGVSIPYWLLIAGSLLIGAFIPGAWRRWRKPWPDNWSLIRWCVGWTGLAVILTLTARWWIFRSPRVQKTSRFRLTGTAEGSVAGKIRGIALHRDGSPYPFLSLHWVGPPAPLETDFRGEFEADLRKGQILMKIDNEPVYLSAGPQQPLFWRIQEETVPK